MAATRDSTLDAGEVRRFGALADEWWDANGKFRPLHKLGPARLAFIRQEIVRHFARPSGGLRPFAGLSVLDIGCGGGLVSEPVARLDATTTGIDPAAENIEAAQRHAAGQGLNIDYRACRVEDLVAEGRTFDCVLCLEVVEHVPDVAAFIAECTKLVRPGGMMILSTINRTVKAYALAIVGAEYILRWLTAGTHQWERFVTPDELKRHAEAANLAVAHQEGIVYSPLTDTWSLSSDLDVNYMASAARPA